LFIKYNRDKKVCQQNFQTILGFVLYPSFVHWLYNERAGVPYQIVR